MQKRLKVRLKGSAVGRKPKHRATLKGLGLTRTGKERELEDTPQVRGMIDQVSYLVEVIEDPRGA